MSPTRRYHAAIFHHHDDQLCSVVAGLIGQALIDRHRAVIVGTRVHVPLILDKLRARMVDVGHAQRVGALVVLDAHRTLETFMRHGMPDADAFRANIGSMVGTLSQNSLGLPLCAFGEMVDILWAQKNSAAAIALERLWSDLADEHQLALLCGYSLKRFKHDEAGFETVCSLHSHIMTAAHDLPPAPPAH